jgi:hypothetical protein
MGYAHQSSGLYMLRYHLDYVSFVSSVIRQYWINIHLDRNNVPYILPRVGPSEQRQREALDGIATMLLSHVVDDIERDTPVDLEDESGNEKPSKDDDDISMHYMQQSSPKASSTRSIDLPFDAHMLPGHGRRFYAVLPLLCVADEENIASLLSSVLYQRHVWGIDEPVVGVAFSRTGTVGQVVLGWLDPESTVDFNLVRDSSYSMTILLIMYAAHC